MLQQVIQSVYTSVPVGDTPQWVFVLCIFVPLSIGIAYLIYLRRIDRLWEKGIFPEKTKYNRDNLLEAYICLAAKILQKDKRGAKDKLNYIKSYLEKNFKSSAAEYGFSLSWALKNPIDHKTVAFWLHKHLKEEAKRMQILYFLVGISMVDDEVIQSEYQLLKEILPILGLKQNQLDQIINLYSFQSKTENNKTNNSSKNEASKKESALKSLGLSNTATLDEIKTAYRKLVKIHHPDRFSNESSEQQKIAHEKFLLIQNAYEHLQIYFT